VERPLAREAAAQRGRGSNSSPTEQRSRRVILWSVRRVMFWEPLSIRVSVGRLTPSIRANACWLRGPLRARRLAAKVSASDIGRMGPRALVHM
jgi:hypothetical protein